MIKFLFICLLFLSFNVSAESSETDTEAGFSYDDRRNSDFCCDRSHKDDFAHDLSAQESQRIVNQILYKPDRLEPSPSSRPSSGSSSGQR